MEKRHIRKTVVVAMDKKSDVAAFLKFIAEEKEECDIIFTSIDLPCWTNDDSILTIGEILNAYVYSIVDVRHEVIGMLNWNDVEEIYYSMLKHINLDSHTYGFFTIDFAEITIRLLLRQQIAKAYNADTIIIGEDKDDNALVNPTTINIINDLMPIKANIEYIDPESTTVDEFIITHDISKYSSFREYRFDRALFNFGKVKFYSAYIANRIKPFVDEVLKEDIMIWENQ